MLKQRIVTAVIAALVLLAILFVIPSQIARGVIAILFIIGAWEWSGFLRAEMSGRYLFVALIATMIVSVLLGLGQVSNPEPVFQLAEKAAFQILSPAEYIGVVFGGGN